MTAREHAEHFCPEKPNAEATIEVAANSRSASLSTTIVSFPPISAMTRFIQTWPSLNLEARSKIRRPTSRDPVKLMKRVSLWSTK